MARLSEADRRILLGDRFDMEEKLLAASENPETGAPSAEKQIEVCRDRKLNAATIFVVGLALLFGGIYLHGSTVGFEKLLGLALLGGGALWYFYLKTRIRKLETAAHA